jgi:fatty acid desaturase
MEQKEKRRKRRNKACRAESKFRGQSSAPAKLAGESAEYSGYSAFARRWNDIPSASETMSRRDVHAPFSLLQARGIVRDLFVPREWIYWADFLSTIAIGYVCFGLTRALYDAQGTPLWLRLLLQLPTFSIQCACFYRAAMFVHEIVHLPQRKFRAFRALWNLLCGIPFLMPSFTYASHLDHHRRQHYATSRDGEYLPLASLSPVWSALYLTQCLWAPPLALVRFGLITPLAWFSTSLRRLIHQRASSLVMDPRYLRPQAAPAELAAIRWQELGCFLFIWGCATVPPLVFHRPLLVLVLHVYLTSVVLILMNSLRTLASHRYTGTDLGHSFEAQMLDSITLDNDSLLAVLLHPVGLRYHATHHLFPALPYHNIRAAHRRLMEQLPPDSPYRLTVERSLAKIVFELLRHSWERGRQAQSQAAASTTPRGGTALDGAS